MPVDMDCTMSGPCPVFCGLPCLSLYEVVHPGTILTGRLGASRSMLSAHLASICPFLNKVEVVSLMALFRLYWNVSVVALLCGHVTSAWACVSNPKFPGGSGGSAVQLAPRQRGCHAVCFSPGASGVCLVLSWSGGLLDSLEAHIFWMCQLLFRRVDSQLLPSQGKRV